MSEIELKAEELMRLIRDLDFDQVTPEVASIIYRMTVYVRYAEEMLKGKDLA